MTVDYLVLPRYAGCELRELYQVRIPALAYLCTLVQADVSCSGVLGKARVVLLFGSLAFESASVGFSFGFAVADRGRRGLELPDKLKFMSGLEVVTGGFRT